MFEYLLYRIGQFLALRLPLKLCYFLAVFISDLRYPFASQDRFWVKKNLKTIFPEKDDKEIRRIRRQMFRNFAKYLVDFLRFPLLDKEYIKKNIRIENLDYFAQVQAKGKGVIALTAHIGNWELGGVVISLLGYPLWAVVLPHPHKKVNVFFDRQREAKSLKVIPLKKATRLCFKVLKEKQILGLVGDRNFSDHGVVVDFFGRPTLFPKGPAELAIKTQAAIVPGFMIRNKDDSYTLKIEAPIEVNNPYSQEALKEIVNQYKNIFEAWIRQYPEQWFMFQKFWME